MTAVHDTDLLERVAKLLAKAADPACTEPERDAFQTKAFQLMAEHRITEAEIASASSALADDELGTWPVGPFDGIYGRVRVQLVNEVGRAFDVRVFWRGYRNSRTLYAYGFRSDVDRVIALSNRLLADADVRARAVQPGYAPMRNPDDGSYYRSERGAVQAATVRERRGFYIGYAEAVGGRLREAARVAEAAHRDAAGEERAESAALVLVDRAARVRDGYAAAHPNVETAGRLASDGTGSGRDDGYAAGARADLSHGNQVRGRRAIGGGR